MPRGYGQIHHLWRPALPVPPAIEAGGFPFVRIDLLKQPRREAIERPSPRLPIVGRSLHLFKDAIDAGLLQRAVEGESALVLRRFGRAGMEVKHEALFVELGRVGEDAAVGRFHVDHAAPAAEGADGGKGVQMR